jgi:ribosomal protein L11 methyltransferase
MNYFEVEFQLEPVLPAREVLIAELAELGFESFVEMEEGLKAYIQEEDFQPAMLESLMASEIEDLQISHTTKLIQDENWNAEWEKNFEPINVEDKCMVRAPFHSLEGSFEYDLIIEPKMSFGTGHHDTTYQMIAELMALDVKNKTVLDMGCGTGVLAILAKKMGAQSVLGIDIDDWAYENSIENFERNKCTDITCLKGGAELLAGHSFDIILANINRNILVRDIPLYAASLNGGGEILFSGFYTMDVPEIQKLADGLNWELVNRREKNEWCMLRYRSSSKS